MTNNQIGSGEYGYFDNYDTYKVRDIDGQWESEEIDTDGDGVADETIWEFQDGTLLGEFETSEGEWLDTENNHECPDEVDNLLIN